MYKRIVMVYKNWHTDEKKEIRYFDTFEDAEKAAKKMIDQFKYWGGGSVPVFIEEEVWTKTTGCRTFSHLIAPVSLSITFRHSPPCEVPFILLPVNAPLLPPIYTLSILFFICWLNPSKYWISTSQSTSIFPPTTITRLGFNRLHISENPRL